MKRNEVVYKLYKKWFIKNLFLFLISIGIFLYIIFISPTWLIYPSILFIFVTIGWGATAYVGMRNSRK